MLFVLKYIEIGNDIKMTLYTINIDNYLLLILDTLIWCFIIIGCCKMAHGILGTLPCRYIKWIGKHSLFSILFYMRKCTENIIIHHAWHHRYTLLLYAIHIHGGNAFVNFHDMDTLSLQTIQKIHTWYCG